ncbi:MAG: AAA family ATPase [Campylobacteraceae bacterium]|nr:AAA family ATPase [Campylobacteraceae bacterium]
MIGRKKELNILHKLCEEKESKLVVVHGRRRIGKTYLIDYMFKNHREDCLFFKFTGSADQDSNIQRDYFIEAIYEWFKVEPTKEINKWHQVFMFLKRVIDNEVKIKKHQGKVVLFIDEIAWIDRHNKAGFLSAFGHFYNTYIEHNNNLIVILCGSNASWIKNKILKDTTGPLYHRVDIELAMLPFDLKETKEYLIKEKRFEIDNKSVVDIYMVLGGIAKYLNYLDSSLSISQNIDNIFFNLNSPLYNEYEGIFKSLFYDKASSHKNIIDLLSKKQAGYTIQELEKLIKDNKLSVIRNHIDELIHTGFVKAINRFSNKTKDTKYIIIDSFCLFYNKWIKALSKNDIASMSNYFENKSNSQDYIIWQGFAFETVCISNIHLYLKHRGLSSVLKSLGYWNYYPKKEILNDKGAQIDLVIEYENNTYDIVECKYYNDEFTIDKTYADNLLNKKTKFIENAIVNKKYDLKMIMLTTYGTKVNQYYNKVNISKDFTLDDLME